MRPIRWLLAVIGGLVVGACGHSDERDPGPVRVVVTIAPLAGLVQPLLPEDSEVRVLIPPGRSEHGFELTPGDVRAIADADLIVLIGLGLEPQVERALRNAPSKRRHAVVFADAVGIESEPHGHDDHAHDHGHDHGPVDPHLWLDPVLVEAFIPVLARSAAEAVAGAAGSPWDVAERERTLTLRIRDLDRAWRESLEPHRGRAIVTHHAAFGRLADRYGLKIAGVVRPIEDMEPTPAQLAAVVGAIREQQVRAIFVEPQYTAGAAERIARELGVRLGRLDPVGDRDWFELMERNRAALVAGLADE